MDDLRLPKSNSATVSGLRATAITTVSAFLVFSTGLWTVLHSIPGCSDAVINYITSNAVQLALMLGVPTGLVTLVVGILTPKKPNY